MNSPSKDSLPGHLGWGMVRPHAFHRPLPPSWNPPKWQDIPMGALMASANRLLKNQFPPHRNHPIYTQLVHRHLASPKPSRRQLEQESVPVVEYLHQHLWFQMFPPEQDAALWEESFWLHLWVLVEDLCQFRPDEWGQGDVVLLTDQEAMSPIHGQVYATPIQPEGLAILLKENYGDLPWFDDASVSMDALSSPGQGASIGQWVKYLVCRWMQQPLPWSVLLVRAEDSPLDWSSYPRLQRLNAIRKSLREDGTLARWQAMALSSEGLESPRTSKTARVNLEAPGLPFALDDFSFPALRSVMDEMARRMQTLSFQEEVRRRFYEALSTNQDLSPLRQDDGYTTFPIRPMRLLVLVEGKTERIILPAVAQWMGYSLGERGVFLLSAGGKNQAVSLYSMWAQWLSIPMMVILDEDAQIQAHAIDGIRRPQDRLIRLSEGELEDMLPMEWIVETLNKGYHCHPALTPHRLTQIKQQGKDEGFFIERHVDLFKFVWRSYNLDEFDKTHFAETLIQSVSEPEVSGFWKETIEQMIALSSPSFVEQIGSER